MMAGHEPKKNQTLPKTIPATSPRKIPMVGRWLSFPFDDANKNTGQTVTLPETNSLPLKMDGWNTTFLLGRPIFRGYVSFREGSFKF